MGREGGGGGRIQTLLNWEDMDHKIDLIYPVVCCISKLIFVSSNFIYNIFERGMAEPCDPIPPSPRPPSLDPPLGH